MIEQLMNLSHTLDQQWVKDELLPLLVVAYGEREPGYWEDAVQRAAENIHELVSVQCHDQILHDGVADFSQDHL
jgi:hypothetical protein